jgi:hypothetical protein
MERFMISTYSSPNNMSNKIKDSEMGGACSINEEDDEIKNRNATC